MDASVHADDASMDGANKPSPGKSRSKTVTDTISGEHEHTIVGYSLIKGIGDGEPIASERFTVGGLEWVLLFYPDGKRSATDHGAHVPAPLPHHDAEGAHAGERQPALENGAGPPPARGDGDAGEPRGPAGALRARAIPPHRGGEGAGPQNVGLADDAAENMQAGGERAGARGRHAPDAGVAAGAGPGDGAGGAERGGRERAAQRQDAWAAYQNAVLGGAPGHGEQQAERVRAAALVERDAGELAAAGAPVAAGADNAEAQAQARLDAYAFRRARADIDIAAAQAQAHAQAAAAAQVAEHSSDYCALFVALIGEGEQPLGVVSTAEGRVVRAFHRFQLVDQSGRGHDVVKGRRREQGAVKISCSRSDPTARNCHGYRKFVKRGVLEDPARGLLVNDTLVVRYRIELVVSSGGALSRSVPPKPAPPLIAVPPPGLGIDLGRLLASGDRSDVVFQVEGSSFPAHRVVLSARSPVFAALLSGPMREGTERDVAIEGVLPLVFRALLHFSYTDALPPELAGAGFEVPMAQHLLAAADRYGLFRLRSMCERRLCETVHVDTVATTLALAEQNNARDLKRVCLSYVASHLHDVLATEGYAHMISACPQLQSELLRVIATAIQPRGDAPPPLQVAAAQLSAGPALSIQPVGAAGPDAPPHRQGNGAAARDQGGAGANGAAARARVATTRPRQAVAETEAAAVQPIPDDAGAPVDLVGEPGASEAPGVRGRANAVRWAEIPAGAGRNEEASVEGPNRRVRPRRD